MSVSRYPLAWPAGWPRTLARDREDSRYRFRSGSRSDGAWGRAGPVTFEVARQKLCEEMERLRASALVISTNLPLRNDGYPYAGAKWGDDPGTAIYFTLRGRQLVMACDRYDAPSANLRSLGLAIEGLRQLERHGGGTMMERAFAGFAALPPPTAHWDILGLPPGTRDKAAIEAAFRAKAMKAHPDQGGSNDAMAELIGARDEALKGAAG